MNAPTSDYGELYYVTNTANTVFYGTPDELQNVIFGPHNSWLETGKQNGFMAIKCDDFNDQFCYTYHFQGDGSYENRINGIKEWKNIDSEFVNRFGINLDKLNEWKNKQSNIPPTLGLTWRRTQPEQLQLSEHYKEIRKIKKQIVATNSSIFDKKPHSNISSIRCNTIRDSRDQ